MLDIRPYNNESLACTLARAAIRYDVGLKELAYLLDTRPTLTENCVGWISQVAEHSGGMLDAKTLLEENTSFKYLTMLFEESRKADITNLCMRRDARISDFLKFFPINHTSYNTLRFCRTCIIDKYNKYGEVIINARHQYPLVYYCNIHKKRLSTISSKYIIEFVSGCWINERTKLNFGKANLPLELTQAERSQIRKWCGQLIQNFPKEIPTRNQRINLIFRHIYEYYGRTRRLFWAENRNNFIFKLRKLLLKESPCATEKDGKLWDSLTFFLCSLASIASHDNIHDLFGGALDLPQEVGFDMSARKALLW